MERMIRVGNNVPEYGSRFFDEIQTKSIFVGFHKFNDLPSFTKDNKGYI